MNTFVIRTGNNLYAGPQWRWRSFKPQEFFCKGSGAMVVEAESLDCLQALRDALGRPIVITSGYRSPDHNRSVGGAVNSYHMKGKAFDCSMAGHEPQEFQTVAELVGFTGFGEYLINRPQPFVHLDTGPRRRWKG